MTEPRDEVFALLDLAVGDPTPQPPIHAVVAAGRRRRRQARGVVVGSAAVAVAVVIVGSLAIAGGTSGTTASPLKAPSLAGPSAAALAHGHWVKIPKPPLTLRYPLVIEAGRQLVTVNTYNTASYGNRFAPLPAAAAYDAATNSWRKIATPDIAVDARAHGVWTGDSLVLVDEDGTATRWNASTNEWQRLPAVPDARPTIVRSGGASAPGVTDLLWTGHHVLANAVDTDHATTYELDNDGKWRTLATFTEPKHGLIFDAPMAVDDGSIYALAATAVLHNNPHDRYTSGSVSLVQLSGNRWIASSPARQTPRSDLKVVTVRGGIAAIGQRCPGGAACTIYSGSASVIHPGTAAARLRSPVGFPYQRDVAAGANAIVLTFPDGNESYGTPTVSGRGDRPGATKIYDTTAHRWLTGPRAPHKALQLNAYWTSAGVADLGNHGGWLLRPARSGS